MARTYLFRQIIRAGGEDCWAGCLGFFEVGIELEGGGAGEEIVGTSGTCAPSLSSLAVVFFFFAMVREQQLALAASCNDNEDKKGMRLKAGCCVAQTEDCQMECVNQCTAKG